MLNSNMRPELLLLLAFRPANPRNNSKKKSEQSVSVGARLPKLAVMTLYGSGDNSGGALNGRTLLQFYPKPKVFWPNTKQNIRGTLRREVYWDTLCKATPCRLHFSSLINACLWSMDVRLLRKLCLRLLGSNAFWLL